MTDKRHGYYVSVPYTSHFYRQMGPDWLDFCMRAQGYDAPRSGADYRYLDLGCGQGFHLCLLAAANPQAEFVGIDFQAEHIAHAEKLAADAQLTNVRFVEADFLDLAQDWPKALGNYDYIALQGILSWISPELRAAVFQCVAHASKPGTVASFGYNSYPGFLHGVPFQHVVNELAKAGGADAAFASAFRMFRQLRDANAPVTRLLPMLNTQLEALADQPTSYLAHEFLTDHWTPLWHSQVARGLRAADFTYAGSAAIAEALLPDSLPPKLRGIIVEQADETLRQDVQDIVIQQQFRRDIFCRSPKRADPAADLDGGALIYLINAPREGAPVEFKTTFGGLTVEYAAVADIVAALADGPKTIAELTALKNPQRPHARSILLSMLDNYYLMMGPAAPGSAQIAERFNAAVARAAAEGTMYENIAAAALGSGAQATQLGLVMLDAWLSSDRNIDQAALAQRVDAYLQSRGRQLEFRGTQMSDEQRLSEMTQLAGRFINRVVPHWRRLGIVE